MLGASATPRRIAAIAAAVFLLILLLFLSSASIRGIGALSSESITGHYPYVKPKLPPWNPPKPKQPDKHPQADGVIVKVELESEGSSWTDTLRPFWRTEVIKIHNGFANLHEGAGRVDRGRVADAYLRWIIENYKILPETIIFLPPGYKQRADHSRIQDAIRRLQVPFIQSSGFAILNCPSTETCNNLARPFRSPSHELRTLEVSMPKVWVRVFGNITMAEELATPPSTEFAVSRAQVQKRDVEEYLRAWTWLNRTIMDDDSAGFVLEYLWPIIFGRAPVFCPEFEKCECSLYDKC
ncbi:hypothetical protein BDW02DRAFT_514881 [Decorospora gaudefroyi]|uniref:Uncharacterized protein n=1 Tax=Decorospora gaudefroyi TaxID=184978 RepID=A0A6A5KUX8_9PLEO|nr:hypothetical protein BDW02DRAFT_514881 [Decorospora gaudefroyi]